MSITYLDDAMDRLFAMQQESLNTLLGYDCASKIWPYFQDTFPYWVTRPGQRTNNDLSQDMRVKVRNIPMRLVLGHWNEGYESELSDRALQFIVAVDDYFDLREDLSSTTYPSDPDFLMPGFGGRIINDTGLVIFDNSGIGALQIGVEFVLELQYLRAAYRNP